MRFFFFGGRGGASLPWCVFFRFLFDHKQRQCRCTRPSQLHSRPKMVSQVVCILIHAHNTHTHTEHSRLTFNKVICSAFVHFRLSCCWLEHIVKCECVLPLGALQFAFHWKENDGAHECSRNKRTAVSERVSD